MGASNCGVFCFCLHAQNEQRVEMRFEPTTTAPHRAGDKVRNRGASGTEEPRRTSLTCVFFGREGILVEATSGVLQPARIRYIRRVFNNRVTHVHIDKF